MKHTTASSNCFPLPEQIAVMDGKLATTQRPDATFMLSPFP
jgi:hypothetical protein